MHVFLVPMARRSAGGLCHYRDFLTRFFRVRPSLCCRFSGTSIFHADASVGSSTVKSDSKAANASGDRGSAAAPPLKPGHFFTRRRRPRRPTHIRDLVAHTAFKA